MKNLIITEANKPTIPVKIQMPACSCNYGCCGDCVFMNLNDSNQFGDYYCGKRRRYYPAGDSTCSDFQGR